MKKEKKREQSKSSENLENEKLNFSSDNNKIVCEIEWTK